LPVLGGISGSTKTTFNQAPLAGWWSVWAEAWGCWVGVWDAGIPRS